MSGYAATADSRAAQKILDTTLVWDMVWPLASEVGNTLDSLNRFVSAGFGVVSLTLAGDRHTLADALRIVANVRAEISSRSNQLQLVTSCAEIEAARRAGKLGVLLHFEGTRCFEREIDTISAFRELGVLYTLLAFNQSNSVGGGCAEERDGGLTRFGRRVVREMQRVGMLVDLSHTGHSTTLDALSIATRPMIFSHSNAYSLAPHYRNVKDDQIIACARIGGVIGISGANEYLGVTIASPQAIFRHIDHIAQLVGTRHVGLGLDMVFDAEALNGYVRSRPDEWPQTADPNWRGFHYLMPEQLLDVVECLLRANYPEEDIRLVLGANFLRVCGAAWAI